MPTAHDLRAPVSSTTGRARGGGPARVCFAVGGGLLFFAAGILALFLWSWHRFGTPSAFPALVGGLTWFVQPSTADAGHGPAGQESTAILRIGNLSGEPLEIQGLAGLCGVGGCVEAEEPLPASIGPWSARALRLKVRLPLTTQTPMRLMSEIYTDRGSREIIISGRSTEAPPEERTPE